MKPLVACVLVLGTFISGVVGQGQKPRRSQKNTSAPQRSETIRVCPGVPIPDGYVIVAYMTSTTCPHGSYLLKKMDSYENSLGVNRTGGAPKSSATDSNDNGNQKPSASKTSAKGVGNSPSRSASPQSFNGLRQSKANSSSASGPASASRPRVVGNPRKTAPGVDPLTASGQSQDEENGPPNLIGSDPARPSGPPTLGRAGSSSTKPNTGDATGPAPEPTPEELGEGDVLRVDTTLVTVPVSVLDRQGRFISNLVREDFTLIENGQEQSIAFFETAEKPFTVALVLDTSASTQFKLSEIKSAALEFARQLRPQDRVLVVTFDREVMLLTEPTDDLDLMATMIEEYANTGTATRLYDAVNLTIAERLNRIKGRKAIVLFTDGVDTASQEATFQSTLEQAEELDALIYPVQYDTSDYMNAMNNAGQGPVTVTTTRRGIFGSSSSTQTYNNGPSIGTGATPGSTKEAYDVANKYLKALADKTGGRIHQANDTRQLSDAFARIAEELRRQYTIGYYPKAGGDDGERREIRVRVRQPNLAVKARSSYIKSSSNQEK